MKKINTIVLIALVFALSLSGCDTKNQIKPTNYPSSAAQVTPAPTVTPTAASPTAQNTSAPTAISTASPSATQSQRFSVYSVENSTVPAIQLGSFKLNISFNGTPGYSLSRDQARLIAVVEDFISVYFKFRQDSFYIANQVFSKSSRKDAIADNSEPIIISDEEERQVKLTQAAEKLNEKWVSANVMQPAIKELNVHGNIISANVYEWTDITFRDKNDSVTQSYSHKGYGVEHEMVFSIENGSIKLNADNYDEGSLTDMHSSTFTPVNISDQMTPDQVITSWLEALRKGDTYTYWSLCSRGFFGIAGGANRIYPHQISNITIEADNNRTNNKVEVSYIVTFDVDWTNDPISFKTGKYHEFVHMVSEYKAWKIGYLAKNP